MANILVVDDIAVMRKKIITMLLEAGHNVIAEAEDGEQAFKEYEKYRPDLVMMDITMPNLDGIGAVKKIIAEYPDARIIMVSAIAQKHMVLMALQCGAKNYILKPAEYSRLVETIDKVLREEANAKRAKVENVKVSSENCRNSTKLPEAGVDTPSFTVVNDNGTFYIKMQNNLDKLNVKSLCNAVQGFLFIKPLNIVFDFAELQSMETEVLSSIIDLYSQIKQVGGSVNFISQNKELKEFFNEQYGQIVRIE